MPREKLTGTDGKLAAAL